VQVTGTDPFASCTKDNVNRQEKAFGSLVYPSTAIEPWVAVRPYGCVATPGRPSAGPLG
jgi:hypothetical protein